MLSSFDPYGSCFVFLKVLWMILSLLYLRNLLILSKLQWKLFFSAVYPCRNLSNSFQKCILLYIIFFFLLVLPLSLCFVSCHLTSLSLPCFSITVDHRHHMLFLTVPMKSKDKSFDFAQGPRTVFGLFSCSLTGGGEREMCKLVALTGWSLLGFLLYWSVLIILKYALWRI